MNPDRSQKTDRPAKRAFPYRWIGTVLSLALMIYLIKVEGWSDLRQALTYVPWYVFAVAIGLALVSRISTTLRWMVLLHYANIKISFWQAFRLMFMGNFASNFLPSTVGGDVVRLAGVVTMGVDSGVGAASLVLDRLVGMAGMASFGPYGLYLVSNQAAGLSAPHTLTMLSFIAGLERIPGMGWLYRKSERFVRSLVSSSIGWFRRPVSLLLALLCTYGHMLSTFLIILLFLRSMHQSISFIAIGALWSLSYFVSLAPISINGLGLQEVSITMLYSRFGNVSMESALALAVLVRVLFLLASLPGALFLPEILRPIKKAHPVS